MGIINSATSILLSTTEVFFMDFESLVKHPTTGQMIIVAIEDGREWGQRFLNDSSWHQNKRRMANYAIQESTRFNKSKQNSLLQVHSANENLSNQDIPPELHTNLYLQVKLASTLFTIYEIDTKSALMHPLIIAAAAGVEMQELANYLGTQTRKSAIKTALMKTQGQSFLEINRNLGVKLMYQINKKDFAQVANFIPNRNSNSPQIIEREKVDTCGYSVMSFINAWNEL